MTVSLKEFGSVFKDVDLYPVILSDTKYLVEGVLHTLNLSGTAMSCRLKLMRLAWHFFILFHPASNPK